MSEQNKQNQNHRRCLWILTPIHIHKNCDGNCERIVSKHAKTDVLHERKLPQKMKIYFFLEIPKPDNINILTKQDLSSLTDTET